MNKKIIALLLSTVTLFLCSIPSYATEKESFISEVSLVYEDSVEDAKKAIEGTDWKLLEYDLNPDADAFIDDGVYLIYKTTENVEDAITDLRVMDMYGGYTTSNYEQQLELSRKGYLGMVGKLRVAAYEFKERYESGDRMALLAYRQMNFYKDVKVSEKSTETDMKMGDFFLNLPSDEKIVQVLMEGNALAVSNLVKLLSVGISGDGEMSLAAKVELLYSEFSEITDDEALAELDKKYSEKAKGLFAELTEFRSGILRYDTIKNDVKIEDENISEEDFVFLANYQPLVTEMEKLILGDTNLCDLVREERFTEKDLYPIVAAFTEGQNALVSLGQFYSILTYSSKEKSVEELDAYVTEIEKELMDEKGEIVPVDVYYNVDRSVFEGSFALTTAADRQQALTGKTWDYESARDEADTFFKVGLYITLGDMSVTALALLTTETFVRVVAYRYNAGLAVGKLTSAISNWLATGSNYATLSTGLLLSAVGVAFVSMGVASIALVYNYYNPNYTVIPNVMVDIRETELGDKYVKYTAARVFGEEEKNADFNAYQGKEWNALYYTKDANAGNCLTPNFKYSDSDSTVQRRYQGVCLFGESKAFDLNSNVYKLDAPSVFLSLRYSTMKKSGASMPEVVGSMFAEGGYYALSALGGSILGVGASFLVVKAYKKRRPKDEETLISENTSEEKVI